MRRGAQNGDPCCERQPGSRPSGHLPPRRAGSGWPSPAHREQQGAAGPATDSVLGIDVAVPACGSAHETAAGSTARPGQPRLRSPAPGTALGTTSPEALPVRGHLPERSPRQTASALAVTLSSENPLLHRDSQVSVCSTDSARAGSRNRLQRQQHDHVLLRYRCSGAGHPVRAQRRHLAERARSQHRLRVEARLMATPRRVVETSRDSPGATRTERSLDSRSVFSRGGWALRGPPRERALPRRRDTQ